jgi:hypothetical protein
VAWDLLRRTALHGRGDYLPFLPEPGSNEALQAASQLTGLFRYLFHFLERPRKVPKDSKLTTPTNCQADTDAKRGHAPASPFLFPFS